VYYHRTKILVPCPFLLGLNLLALLYLLVGIGSLPRLITSPPYLISSRRATSRQNAVLLCFIIQVITLSFFSFWCRLSGSAGLPRLCYDLAPPPYLFCWSQQQARESPPPLTSSKPSFRFLDAVRPLRFCSSKRLPPESLTPSSIK